MNASGISKRYAVLIGNSVFTGFPEDELAPLKTPTNDIRLLKEAFSNPERGGFEVDCLENCESGVIKRTIETLIMKAKDPDALGLIYYSGHGLLDQMSQLRLAAADSQPKMWSTTVAISEISDLITVHRPKRLIILLDCCYSGAGIIGLELKGPGSAAANSVRESLKTLSGEGVVMMTATTPVQQAAGNTTTGFGLFTKHVAEGIGAAKARRSHKQMITVNDLYAYVSDQMKMDNCDQTPMLWNAQAGGDIILSESSLLGTHSKPISPRLAWKFVRGEKVPILNVIGPTYILDRNYNFVDWNTAFEFVIAHPLGLTRGSHVESFLRHLRNWNHVFNRSNSKFVPGNIPTVDIEILEYDSPDYGLIVFNKVATQLVNSSGRQRAWCVALNVSSVQRPREFWRRMEDVLKRDINWSRYALSYDKIISRFTEYQQLLGLVVSKVGSACRCADLGAGTGNVTMKLLESGGNRRVLAIEKNETMLDALQRKLDQSEGFSARASLSKGDITTCLREEQAESLDACVMLNVLFALEHPDEALSSIYRVLRPGGILSLSTSHQDTDIKNLFGEMQRDLRQQGSWDAQANATWEDAYRRNIDMEDLIKRHSKDEIRAMIEHAGFTIEEFHPDEYVGCVVVVKASKRQA